MKTENYIPQKAKIIKKEYLCDDVASLRLKILGKKPLSFLPGQFVMLSVLGFGEVPIGITSAPKEKRYFEVAVRSVGMVTKKILALKEGDYVGVSGPFGNGFPLSKIKGKDLVLVAGGIGLAPLRSLIKHIAENRRLVKSLTIFNGARCPEQLLFRDEYSDWRDFSEVSLSVESCDSSWKDCVGNISEIFGRTKIKRGSIMIVCGPPPMFDPVINHYAGKSVSESDLYFLLERKMKCGVGKCQHCTCGELYVCLDGPVFAYDKIKYNQEAFK
jgi:NAD(P)H-flavin reductase